MSERTGEASDGPCWSRRVAKAGFGRVIVVSPGLIQRTAVTRNVMSPSLEQGAGLMDALRRHNGQDPPRPNAPRSPSQGGGTGSDPVGAARKRFVIGVAGAERLG